MFYFVMNHSLSEELLKLGRQFIFGIIRQKFHYNLSVFCNSAGLKENRLLLPSLALDLDCDKTFWPITVISESVCSHWLLYTALLSNRRCHYKLIGC